MTQKGAYQLHLSRGDVVLRDVQGRTRKANKILSVLRDFRQLSSGSLCLDIGCSSGVVTSLLGEHFGGAIGIDIDQDAVHYAKEHSPSAFARFIIGDSMVLPFRDGSVDVVVCNHIYEHVPQADRMMDEIFRVLKREGICYFAAGNRHMIVEGHYGLPFLSWLPGPLSNLYLKCTGKGDFYYEQHLSLRGLKRLVRKFQIHDYTLSIIREPERFFATDLVNSKSFLFGWVRRLAPHLYPWIPTYVWVLTKK